MTTLEELDLSVRTFNCLGRHGCRTLGDLLSMKRSDFMKVRGLNEKCLEEIERKLNSLGFTIEGDSEQARYFHSEGYNDMIFLSQVV